MESSPESPSNSVNPARNPAAEKGRQPPGVAVAGASGFVGSRLRADLAGIHRWIGLTRTAKENRGAGEDGTEWRSCDLFSLPQVEEALRGADQAVYLVHSMLPSSRLVQGNFADMDLLLADNFARGARAAGVRHVIYLGGLLPSGRENLSPHLASRLEVENVLRQSGPPLTVLRAGLVIGPGGSSTRMLINLVRRLPMMILPRWTRSRTQSIDARDAARAFGEVLADESLWGGTYDLAGHPVMTYREMILRTSALMGRKVPEIPYPFHSIKLSRLWVSLISGMSAQLVNPLLESLTHPLEASPNPLLDRIAARAVPFDQSIRDALDDRRETAERDGLRKRKRRAIRSARRVRSVQRLPLPPGWNAGRVEEVYGTWLTRAFRGLLRVDRDGDGVLRFRLRWPSATLLELTPTPFSLSAERRRAFYISGGFLHRRVDPPGRLEFRLFPELGCLVAAIHDYAPGLPWWIYAPSQARVHLWVMAAFGRYLSRIGREGEPE